MMVITQQTQSGTQAPDQRNSAKFPWRKLERPYGLSIVLPIVFQFNNISTVCITPMSKNTTLMVAVEFRQDYSSDLAFYLMPMKPLEPKNVDVDYLQHLKLATKSGIMHAEKKSVCNRANMFFSM